MSWDKYFLNVVETVAKNSKCLSRQVGALLVDNKNILVTGYNGPPSGVPHCGERYFRDEYLKKEMEILKIKYDESFISTCPRYVLGYKSGQGLYLCVAGHAERNVLITAAKHGISTKGRSLYLSCGVPCKDCLIEIINSGIKEVVVTKMSYYDEMTPYLVDYSNLEIREYKLED